jgi:hypothetical protein
VLDAGHGQVCIQDIQLLSNGTALLSSTTLLY